MEVAGAVAALNLRAAERRLLQIVVAAACLVPLAAGGSSILRGVSYLKGVPLPVPASLDSHFRYLSGIFFALGIAVVTCIPAIERKGPRLRLLGAMVVAGGFARLLSWVEVGAPSRGHQLGLVMELGAMPLLMLWQWRVARRWADRAG
ncbi:MAG: hypothetical protein JWL91_542 [Sphingomonas bacterium]|jgi:hypothetical protein|nr:DUF4345 domain-containing protein [Sphingomonas bacterium]MDB5688666.1 hypothetical protein [Sphingomonas bacterium]